jgi:hypothetical protein
MQSALADFSSAKQTDGRMERPESILTQKPNPQPNPTARSGNYIVELIYFRHVVLVACRNSKIGIFLALSEN